MMAAGSDTVNRMGRILGGALLAIGLMLGFSSTARAVEIPATAECQTTFKELIQKGSEKPRGKSVRAGLKPVVTGLVEAGCLSDAAPMLRDMKPMPFSEQCAAAASEAQQYWGPLTARARPWMKAFERKVRKPFRKRSNRLWAKIDRADRKGQDRRSRALLKKLERISGKFLKRNSNFVDRVTPFFEPHAAASILGFWELVSLRCVGGGDVLDSKTGGPAQRVLRKNLDFVWSAMFLFNVGEDDNSASTSAVLALGQKQ